jgi:2-oxo-4-hydroxy-4-carboxy-5-ureidoimidazoline decarboxylase
VGASHAGNPANDTPGRAPSASHDRLPLAAVNALSAEAFVDRFGGVFEHSPWVAEGAADRRPWATLADLHRAMCAVVRGAAREQQLALIRAHPDLVGRAALAGTLTRESTAEQRAAGLDPGALTPEEIARFRDGNAAYRGRFGFPFVICAREHSKAAILAALETRLANDREEEIAVALAEIEKIARLRLADLVADAPSQE